MGDTYYIYIGKGHERHFKWLQWQFKLDGKIFAKGEYIMTTLKQGQTVSFALVALDFKGRPARLDGVPTYTNSNAGAADLFVAEDGLSGTITWLDGGAVQIVAKADADLGEGVRELVAIADIDCLAPEAVTMELQMGVPTP